MKKILFLSFLVTYASLTFANVSNDPLAIAKANRLKKQAENAYKMGNMQEAAKIYSFLKDSLNENSAEISLNLAHALYQSGDTSQAMTHYTSATFSEDIKVKSAAYQQLGVLARDQNKLQESLNYLKSAIKADPTNTDARYDYEVVKKLLKQQESQQKENQENKEENEEQNQDQQNQENQEGKNDQKKDNQQNQESNQDQKQDEQKQDEQNKSEQQKTQEEKEAKEAQEKAIQEKLKEMNLSEEKAKMILEAMKNSEIQYLQQLKRKATERPKTGKPDW